MKVIAVWEFDADVEDIDPKHVDIPGLAKDLTKIELAHLLNNRDLSASDFSYAVML